MRLLINGLSVSNISGRHVLLGLLSQFVRLAGNRDEITVLYNSANEDLCTYKAPSVQWLKCPGSTAHWAGRLTWERFSLPRLIREVGADVYFSPAGTIRSGLNVPQASFGQNPLAMIADISRTPFQKFKTALQKRGYRQAVRQADLLLFNSRYMRDAYRENAGCNERASGIVYLGLAQETLQASERVSDDVNRNPNQIVSVSVMTPHKDIATLIRAVHYLKDQNGLHARLVLAGPWADHEYEKSMRRLARELSLDGAVEFRGVMPHVELHKLYAQSKVFSLLSRSESFGIPAVEAQAFGTPVVGADCCATPEVCGDGGLYVRPGDWARAAEQIAKLITDEQLWSTISKAAHENSKKYRWENAASELKRVFELAQ